MDNAGSIIAYKPQKERAQAFYQVLVEILSTLFHLGSPGWMKEWCRQQHIPQAPSLYAVENKASGDHGAPLHSGASPLAAPLHDCSVTRGHFPGGLENTEVKQAQTASSWRM